VELIQRNDTDPSPSRKGGRSRGAACKSER
jgi:hypothetical protein